MSRAPWMHAAAVFLLAVSARAAPAPEAPSPLAQVPAAAPFVLYVHGVADVLDHEIALFQGVLPDRAKELQSSKESLLKTGVEDGRRLKGLKKDGPFFVVLMAPLDKASFEDPPRAALVAAVDSYKDFRDGLLTEDERKSVTSEDGVDKVTIEITFIFSKTKIPLFFIDKGDYAVVTLRMDTARDFLKTGPGLDGNMPKDEAARFLAADLSAYLAVDVFSRDYPDQVKQARQAIEDSLKASEDSGDPTRKALAAVGRRAADRAFRAAEDGRGLLATWDYGPDGVAVHVETEFRPGSTTAGLLEGSRFSEFKDLGTLPSGRLVYAGVEPSPALSRLLGETLYGAGDPDAKGAGDVRAALDALEKAGPGTRLLAYGLPPAGLDVERYDDPEKAAAARARLADAMGAGLLLPAGVFKEKPEIKSVPAKYKGFEVRSVRLAWDADAAAAELAEGAPDPTGQAQRQSAAALKKLLGDGTTLWVGTDGKAVFQVAAPDWGEAEKRLDAYFRREETVGGQEAFAEVRRALPAEASVVAVLDAAQYEVAFADVMKPLRDVYGPGLVWKAPPADAHGYVGLAVTLRPERAAADLFVSARALRYAHPWTFAWLTPPW